MKNRLVEIAKKIVLRCYNGMVVGNTIQIPPNPISWGVKIHASISLLMVDLLLDDEFANLLTHRIFGIKIGYYSHDRELTLYIPVENLCYLPNLLEIFKRYGFHLNPRIFYKIDKPVTYTASRILIAHGDTNIFARVSSYFGKGKIDQELRNYYLRNSGNVVAINRAWYHNYLYNLSNTHYNIIYIIPYLIQNSSCGHTYVPLILYKGQIYWGEHKYPYQILISSISRNPFAFISQS